MTCETCGSDPFNSPHFSLSGDHTEDVCAECYDTLRRASAEKDAKLARAERDVELLTKARESYDADRRAAVQEMGGWRERATLAERELAEQSATLARLEQQRDEAYAELREVYGLSKPTEKQR